MQPLYKYSSFLPQFKNMYGRLNIGSKLAVGVNASIYLSVTAMWLVCHETLALEEVSQLSFKQIQVWQPTQTTDCSWEPVVTSRESLLNQLRDARLISD